MDRPDNKTCNNCRGQGFIKITSDCPRCGGRGYLKWKQVDYDQMCPMCMGKGTVWVTNTNCIMCNGKGYRDWIDKIVRPEISV